MCPFLCLFSPFLLFILSLFLINPLPWKPQLTEAQRRGVEGALVR